MEDTTLRVPYAHEKYHKFRSKAGDLYEIEQDPDGNLSWDFSMCSNRVTALVDEIWRLKRLIEKR